MRSPRGASSAYHFVRTVRGVVRKNYLFRGFPEIDRGDGRRTEMSRWNRWVKPGSMAAIETKTAMRCRSDSVGIRPNLRCFAAFSREPPPSL